MKKIYSFIALCLVALGMQAATAKDVAGSYSTTYVQFTDGQGTMTDVMTKDITVTADGSNITISGLLANDITGTFDEIAQTITVVEGKACGAVTIEVEDGVLIFPEFTPTDEYAIVGAFAKKADAKVIGTPYEYTMNYQLIDYSTWAYEDKTATGTCYIEFKADGTFRIRNFWGCSHLTGNYTDTEMNFYYDPNNYTDYKNLNWNMTDWNDMTLRLKKSGKNYSVTGLNGSGSIMGVYFNDLTFTSAEPIDVTGAYSATYVQFTDGQGTMGDITTKDITVTKDGSNVTISGLLANDITGTYDEAAKTITVAEGKACGAVTIEVEDGVLIFPEFTPTDEYAIVGAFAKKADAKVVGTPYNYLLNYQLIDYSTWSYEDKTATGTCYIEFKADGTFRIRDFWGCSHLTGNYTDTEMNFVYDPNNYTDYKNLNWNMTDWNDMTLRLAKVGEGYSVTGLSGSGSIMGIYFDDLVFSTGDPTAIQSVKVQTPVTATSSAIFNLRGQRLSAPVKGQINIIGGRKVYVK